MNNKNINFLIVIFIFCFPLFFSVLKLSRGYAFDWDQSSDATKVFSIISQKKPILIGPRVSNDSGFFVGPYHYYILLPFFLLTKGDPVAGSYAVVFVNVLTAIVCYFLTKKISDQKTAVLSSIFISIISNVSCWNVMYTPLIAITAFYICYQTINHKFNFPLAMLFAGFISNIHLVPISLVPIIILSFLLSSKKPNLKEIFLGTLCFIIPFLPLVIFDFRHNFLNLSKILSMFFGQKDPATTLIYKGVWLRSFWRSLNILGFFPQTFERVFFLAVLITTPFFIKGNKNKILILIWILFPLLVLSQYKGATSEYYYGMITSLIPFFFSLLFFKFIKNKIITILLFLLIIFISVYLVSNQNIAKISLNDKIAIASYLTHQKQDQPFNLSYETGVGFDFGFDYLFTYLGNQPQNTNNAHLYTLFTDGTLPKNSNVVYKKSIYSLVRR